MALRGIRNYTHSLNGDYRGEENGKERLKRMKQRMYIVNNDIDWKFVSNDVPTYNYGLSSASALLPITIDVWQVK